MIGGALELTEHSFMRTGKAIAIDDVTESICRMIHCGIDAIDATTESLASLVKRLGHAADRLDPA
jgi:dihydropteroate synthase